MSICTWRLFRKTVCSLSALAAAAIVAAPSHAGVPPITVNLGAGWQASWDGTLVNQVSITNISISGNTIFLTKNATFTQGPAPSGLFPTIPINFIQTATSTINHIVIQDEVITNNTGVAWNGFRMDILGGAGIASFDVAATAASGGPLPIGFDISPFTTAAFSNGDRQLDIGGGTVANGAQWLPGSGVNGGALWINVTSQAGAPFSTFQLKETPLPEPGAMALLTIAGLMAGRRGRRR